MLWICRRSSVEAIVYVHSLLFYLTDPSDILTRLRYPFSNKKSQCAKIAFSGFFVCVAFIFQSIFVIFCFFMFFINFSFCSMPTDFIWLLKFSRDRGAWSKFFNFYLKSDFSIFFLLDSVWNFLPVFFKQIQLSSYDSFRDMGQREQEWPNALKWWL